ncbi:MULTISPECIES: amidohydrolase family protein [Sulfolobaceae]|uniref:amidohydrolase family protein n=1 Tax=Sulfolobaceae TaxID=118883 RepID=UPI001EE7CA72|nr:MULTISPECIES: amidohydrolase family protein [unclassified Sulfolobus]
MIIVETKDGKKEEIPIIDYHVHVWKANEENWLRPELAKGWIDCFYDYHKSLSPEDYLMDYNTFKYYGSNRMIEDVFINGYVDIAITQPQYLQYFYREPFGNTEEFGKLALSNPHRFVIGTRWDPRDGEEGKKKLEEDVRRYRVKPWQMRHVKLYTAEWKDVNGKLSRGWRLDSKEAFDFIEFSKGLGIDILVAHKGPTVWPLDKDAFDITDVDAAASSFPEIKFVVTHIGLPRLDDFVWTAVQDKNIYAGLAVASAFIHKRPRYFAQIMAELLFWLGPDRILMGSDYAIWNPKWILEEFMKFELPQDVEKEYGVELTLEVKKKILFENASKLWGISLPPKDDEIGKRAKPLIVKV